MMSEMSIADWKQWYESLERRKLNAGPVSLTTIRPKHPPITLLSSVGDGVHPLASLKYERHVDGEDRRND